MKRDLLTPLDFSAEELDQLFDRADDIRLHPEKYAHACEGRKMSRPRGHASPTRPPC